MPSRGPKMGTFHRQEAPLDINQPICFSNASYSPINDNPWSFLNGGLEKGHPSVKNIFIAKILWIFIDQRRIFSSSFSGFVRQGLRHLCAFLKNTSGWGIFRHVICALFGQRGSCDWLLAAFAKGCIGFCISAIIRIEVSWPISTGSAALV